MAPTHNSGAFVGGVYVKETPFGPQLVSTNDQTPNAFVTSFLLIIVIFSVLQIFVICINARESHNYTAVDEERGQDADADWQQWLRDTNIPAVPESDWQQWLRETNFPAAAENPPLYGTHHKDLKVEAEPEYPPTYAAAVRGDVSQDSGGGSV
jgi:hypothetical protein